MNVHLKALAPRPMARVRLVLIPFAGAGAGIFRGWAGSLSPAIEPFALQLPGREDAPGPFISDWAELIASARAALAALPPGPLAFYGHSLGALVALDLARALPSRTAHLFCAARPWPGAPAPDRAVVAADGIDAARLIAVYGEAPPSFSDPEIRDYALPILVADLALLNSYAYAGTAGLACPLTVLAGSRDPVTAQADLSLWSRETTGVCDILRIEDGHYFLESARERLTREISRALESPP